MSDIKLQTTVNVDFNTWIEQAKRFASISDVVSQNNMPIDTPTSGKAIIEISYNTPLHNGFNGRVCYFQNYTKTFDSALLDENGLPTETTEQITKNVRHKIIDYNMVLSVVQIEFLLDQAIENVPSEIQGYIKRQQAAVGLIALQDVIVHRTFNLQPEQFELL